MPTVPRAAKAAGATTYVGEVARGVPDIIDQELDNDIDPLYNLINGRLDDDNISGSPKKIQASKLNLAGAVGPGTIQPGTVTGGPSGSIALKTITVDNMQLFGSVQGESAPANDTFASIALGNPGPSSVLCDATWTSRGGPILVFGEFQGEAVNTDAGPNIAAQATLTLVMTREPGTANQAVVWQRALRANVGVGGCITPMTLCVPVYATYVLGGLPSLPATAHWQLTMQITHALIPGPAGSLTVNHLHSRIVVMEMA